MLLLLLLLRGWRGVWIVGIRIPLLLLLLWRRVCTGGIWVRVLGPVAALLGRIGVWGGVGLVPGWVDLLRAVAGSLGRIGGLAAVRALLVW